MNLNMELGERRHVGIEIRSTKKEEFEVSNGTYELKRCSDAEIEDTGEVNIMDSKRMDVLICPEMIGEYDLRFIYHIADEIFVDIVRVRVT